MYSRCSLPDAARRRASLPVAGASCHCSAHTHSWLAADRLHSWDSLCYRTPAGSKPRLLCIANVIHKSSETTHRHIARQPGLYPAAPCRVTVTLNNRALSDATQTKTISFLINVLRTTHAAFRLRSSITVESFDRTEPPANAFASDSQGDVGCVRACVRACVHACVRACVCVCVCVCQCLQQVHTPIAHHMHEQTAHAHSRC